MRSKSDLYIKPDIRKVVILYFIAVVLYVFIASFMKVAPHVRVDEDLYVSLAKSFHRGDGFIVHGEVSDYSSVLYSMILSLAYFFYKPSAILMIMRIMNAFIMCSAVFPVYLLSGEILPANRVFCVCVFSLLIPDMIDILYIMQENLYYPVATWCFYFIFKDFKQKEKIGRYTALSIISLILLFFTKNVGLAFAFAYVLSLLMIHKRQGIKKAVLFVTSFAVAVLIWKYLIAVINNFRLAGNHYADQIRWLFPISEKTFAGGITGVIFYFIFVALSTGGGISIVLLTRKLSEKDAAGRLFEIYIFTSLILMILEIVGTIFLTEERGEIIPHKVLFRYVFPLLIPLVIVVVRQLDDKKMDSNEGLIRAIFLCIGLSFFGSAIYYLIVGLTAHTSVIDSHINLLLETGNKLISPFFAPVILVIGGMIVMLITGAVRRKNGFKGLIRTWCVVMTVIISIMLPLDAFWHNYYSRVIVDGDARQSDFVMLADSLGTDDIKVYVMGHKNSPECMVFGYIYQDYIIVENASEITSEGTAVLISPKGSSIEPAGFKKSEIEYSTIDVWESM